MLTLNPNSTVSDPLNTATTSPNSPSPTLPSVGQPVAMAVVLAAGAVLTVATVAVGAAALYYATDKPQERTQVLQALGERLNTQFGAAGQDLQKTITQALTQSRNQLEFATALVSHLLPKASPEQIAATVGQALQQAIHQAGLPGQPTQGEPLQLSRAQAQSMVQQQLIQNSVTQPDLRSALTERYLGILSGTADAVGADKLLQFQRNLGNSPELNLNQLLQASVDVLKQQGQLPAGTDGPQFTQTLRNWLYSAAGSLQPANGVQMFQAQANKLGWLLSDSPQAKAQLSKMVREAMPPTAPSANPSGETSRNTQNPRPQGPPPKGSGGDPEPSKVPTAPKQQDDQDKMNERWKKLADGSELGEQITKEAQREGWNKKDVLNAIEEGQKRGLTMNEILSKLRDGEMGFAGTPPKPPGSASNLVSGGRGDDLPSGHPLQNDVAAVKLVNAIHTYNESIQNSPLHPKIKLELLAKGAVLPEVNIKASEVITGIPPTFISQQALDDVVRQAAGAKKTLVLYTGSSEKELASLQSNPSIVLLKYDGKSSLDDVKRLILDRPDAQSFERIVAVGGGMVQDTAKLAALLGTRSAEDVANAFLGTKSERVLQKINETAQHQLNPQIQVVGIPTALGTTAQATAIAVDKTEGNLVKTPAPDFIVVPINKVRDSDMAPGAADRVVGWYGQQAVEAALQGKNPTEFLQANAPTEVDFMRWMTTQNLTTWAPELKGLMAYYQSTYPHPRPNNDKPIGWEHDFFDGAALKHMGQLTHGEWVAVGSLIMLTQVGQLTGDSAPYQNMRAFLDHMGMPTTYAQLEAKGLSRDMLLDVMQTSLAQNQQSGRKAVVPQAITNATGGFDRDKAAALLDQAMGDRR